jgi:mannose/cellobiose epimerase-like protein (N-acyl-D-glucosamine 2-epimerase family)
VTTLQSTRRDLTQWLVGSAYPLWSRHGIDPSNGGFVEAIALDGMPLAWPRRARIHPRQIYAFAHARTLGWRGDVAGIARRGMDYFMRYYRREDGLFVTLADAEGTVMDQRVLLYDQAFALLGYAAAGFALDAHAEFETLALELCRAIEIRLGASDGAYSAEEGAPGYEANPHMHLLEAYLAWAEMGVDSSWASRVQAMVELALTRFIRSDSGALAESFRSTWQPSPGAAGRLIEPGHQFEWAWLLLRAERWCTAPLRDAALRLIAIGSQFGVQNGVAVNSLYDDFTIADVNARFWPQTERLKALLLAASVTGESQYWLLAESAAESFLPYLRTRVPGLWFDVQTPSGELIDSPAQASTFYHVVGAVLALNLALPNKT